MNVNESINTERKTLKEMQPYHRFLAKMGKVFLATSRYRFMRRSLNTHCWKFEILEENLAG